MLFPDRLDNIARRRVFWLCCAVCYFLIAYALYAVIPASRHATPDSGAYIDMARTLAARFQMDVGLRLPAYPLLLSVPLHFGADLVPAIICIQALLGFFCATCVAKVADIFVPENSNAVFFLTLFNPYGLLSAQLVLPETFFAAVLAAQALALVTAYEKRSLAAALLSGALTAVLALTRANAVVLLAGYPFLIAVALLQKDKRSRFPGDAARCAAHLLAAALVLAPWLGYVHARTGQVSLIPPQYSRFAKYEAFRYINSLLGESAESDAIAQVNHRICAVAAANDGNCRDAPQDRLYDLASERFWSILGSYGTAQLTRGLVKSMSSYFLSTGASLVEYCLGPGQRFMSVVSALLLCFIAVVRIFDVLGVYYAVKGKNGFLLAVAAIYIALYLLPIGFFGMARYRYPVDFFFVILACYGYAACMTRRRLRAAAAGKTRV
ncbi:MAG TPA: hypothetical protein PKD41_05585 [Solidesulfovibrio sp.]|nr:hypothetical protein [Desulfovibrio sp.]HML60340.1 hypothetical protein [Solidesulfovibrio sp.]